MPASRPPTLFTTIRTEGALLPPELLARIAEGDKGIEGLRPEDYHLTPGERVNEATNRAWTRLQAAWTNFQAVGVGDTSPGTTATRERWLLPLFQELGFGRLVPARAVEMGGKTYPVSHAWGPVAIHLVAAGVDLDTRTAGVAGAARTSPHGVVQELLNASEAHLWAMVSNGRRLRLLHDNVRLTRQAFVEWDLQAMMDGEVYSDFVVLWLLCHQSRFEGASPADCWLERWTQVAQDQGTRLRDRLRDGVTRAIEVLGAGFLQHPANGRLREQLQRGELDAQEYYWQLLRLMYRFIFLFVAEDRDLLLLPTASPETREAYALYYSTARLRRLAGRIRGTRHSDLYAGIQVVMAGLGADNGCPELGLPGLDSFLFAQGGRGALPALDASALTNSVLLQAIRHLAYTEAGGVRRPVDYKNLGAEELGSIYESLLEMHPTLDTAGTFALTTGAGNERKTTGAYYTPTSLIGALLDSALDPVLEEAAGRPDPEAAILALTVCDPACGSGHFLVAAAHRIAKRLASVRTGDREPSPDAIRHALRDVIGHCIFGVDLNPMSVELCKVSLWMEALEPGKPLSFLDAHIQCGNALLGTTPALMAEGIPDAAFDPITGDDKGTCALYRKMNREYRKGQDNFLANLGDRPYDRVGNLPAAMMAVEAIADDTVAGIRRKQERYAELVESAGYRYGKLLADAWCAAFVWQKTPALPTAITEKEYRRIERRSLAEVPDWMHTEIRRLADRYQFLHWHLAFPTVFRLPVKDESPENRQAGWSGGFDVVLGNPPWERIKIQEQEWFAQRRPDIAAAANAAARKRTIAALQTEDPALGMAFQDAGRQAEGESHLVRDSGRFPLCGRGDVNTYSIFAETMRLVVAPPGRVGCIVPSGIATDDTTKFFFQDLMDTHALVSLYDFENREGLFPGAHREQKFSLVTLSGAARPATSGATFVFMAVRPVEVQDPDRRFTLSAQDIALLNPNTHTAPIFRSKRDAELTNAIYRRLPVLIQEGPPAKNPWGMSFLRMFDMANDSGLFRTRERLEAEGWRLEGNIFCKADAVYVPLYEGKLTDSYNHRVATFADVSSADIRKGNPREVAPQHLISVDYLVLPRFWVPANASGAADMRSSFHLSFHRVANPNNERTALFTILPDAGVGDSLFLIESINPKTALLLCALGNSFIFDYVVRRKVGSRNFSFFVVKQIAAPTPDQIPRWVKELACANALELTYTAWDLEPFAQDCGWQGPPFRWDEERRFWLRAELDAAYFHLYGIARADVDYIMDTFPIVRRKDEAHYGEYRTKRVILEIYDALAVAQEQGTPYQTVLDPPPADPRVAHPPREGQEPGHWTAPAMVQRSALSSPGLMSMPSTAPVASDPEVAPSPKGSTPKSTAITGPSSAGTIAVSQSRMPGFEGSPHFQQERIPGFADETMPCWRIGDQVRHQRLGVGQVVDIAPYDDDHLLTIQFPGAGTKQMAARMAKLERV